MNINTYSSLSKLKEDLDEIATELINLDSDDVELIESLKKAYDYFNLLDDKDFVKNDTQKLNESKAIISHFNRVLNTIIVKWRKKL
jgi:hypothetical protein